MISFSPDGNNIVTTSHDGTAKIRDLKNSKLIKTFTGHISDVHSARYSPDGKRIVTAHKDMVAIIWDSESGELIDALDVNHTRRIIAAVIPQKGKNLLLSLKFIQLKYGIQRLVN